MAISILDCAFERPNATIRSKRKYRKDCLHSALELRLSSSCRPVQHRQRLGSDPKDGLQTGNNIANDIARTLC